MTATPAQVANDMAAQAKYWLGRDMDIELACQAAGEVIRCFLAGKQPHGNSIAGALNRIQRLVQTDPRVVNYPVWKSLLRAEQTIRDFRANVELAR